MEIRDELLAAGPTATCPSTAPTTTARRRRESSSWPRRGTGRPTRRPSVAPSCEGKVVISMANALVRVGNEFQPLVPPRGSVAAHVQAAVPGRPGGAAFHHLPARSSAPSTTRLDSDVLDLLRPPRGASRSRPRSRASIPGCRPLDAGSLSNAAPIEAFTAVLLQLNVRYKTRVAVRMTGIPDPSEGSRHRARRPVLRTARSPAPPRAMA